MLGNFWDRLLDSWDRLVYFWWLYWFPCTLGFAALFLAMILIALLNH